MAVRRFVFAFIVLLIAAVAAGCGGGTEGTQKVPQGNNAAVSEKVALPEERPSLIGKVKEIVGNEVTVFKGEVPQNQGTPAGQPANQDQAQGAQGARPQNRGMGMTFSGETETFLIPVGTPIVTMQRGTGEVSQVGLTEIKKDAIIRVWKNEDAISFVQVMGANMPRGTGQGAGGNRQGAGTGAGGGIPPGMGGGPPGMGGSR